MEEDVDTITVGPSRRIIFTEDTTNANTNTNTTAAAAAAAAVPIDIDLLDPTNGTAASIDPTDPLRVNFDVDADPFKDPGIL